MSTWMDFSGPGRDLMEKLNGFEKLRYQLSLKMIFHICLKGEFFLSQAKVMLSWPNSQIHQLQGTANVFASLKRTCS